MHVTQSKLNSIKDNLTKMIISITNINTEECENRRNNINDITMNKHQNEIDHINIITIRNLALNIFDECNNMLL